MALAVVFGVGLFLVVVLSLAGSHMVRSDKDTNAYKERLRAEVDALRERLRLESDARREHTAHYERMMFSGRKDPDPPRSERFTSPPTPLNTRVIASTGGSPRSRYASRKIRISRKTYTR